ncbi:MAG: hypothetical protein WC677_07255 [Clostridia bacterium]|jgi:DNA-binding transcriptional regulator YiaG
MKKIIIGSTIAIFVIAGITLLVMQNIGDMIINEVISNEIGTSEITSDLGKNNSTVSKDVNTNSNENNDKPNKNADNSNVTESKRIFSPQEIERIRSEVTFSDKISAATFVLTRLSVSEIIRLKEMMNGGVTAEEKAEAKKIVYSNFTKSEISKLIEIYNKYV